MNEISTGGVLVLALSSFLLFLAAAQKFNTPPTNRSGTTFALFYVGLLFYFFMLVAVWLCTMAFLASGGASVFHLELNEATKNILPLVAAIIVLVASNPSYEPIKTLEETARRICVRLASIPLFAEQLANELAHRARFRVVSERLKERVTEVISDNIGVDAVNFTDDRSMSSRFTRAIALYWLFVEPHNNGTPLEFPLDPSTKSA